MNVGSVVVSVVVLVSSASEYVGDVRYVVIGMYDVGD